jgi:hypothetical protein
MVWTPFRIESGIGNGPIALGCGVPWHGAFGHLVGAEMRGPAPDRSVLVPGTAACGPRVRERTGSEIGDTARAGRSMCKPGQGPIWVNQHY